MANLVSVERASLALGTTHILDGVSLGVSSGTRVGVVGRNGGGKSTLLPVSYTHLTLPTNREV